MTNEDSKRLYEVLAAIYARSNGEVRISPSWLATAGMAQLDPDRISPSDVYVAAHLQLRQIARGLCGKKCEDDGSAEQHELWPMLQKRYPAAHHNGDEPVYVLLDHLSEKDVAFNIGRLRKEASAKLQHADALEAWWNDRPRAAA